MIHRGCITTRCIIPICTGVVAGPATAGTTMAGTGDGIMVGITAGITIAAGRITITTTAGPPAVDLLTIPSPLQVLPGLPTAACAAIPTKAARPQLLPAEVLHGAAVVAPHRAAVIAVAQVAPEVLAGRPPAILSRVRLKVVVAAAHPMRFRALQVAGVNSVSCSA